MRYKFFSAIVILCTLISVVIMLFANRVDQFPEGEKVSVKEIKRQTKTVEKTTEERGDSKKQKIEDIIENKNDVESDDEVEEDNKEAEESRMLEEEQFESNTEVPGLTIINKETEGNENLPDSTAVFKINAEEIEEELSLSDKVKLLPVVTKISPMDYAQISKYLEDNNRTRAIINTFGLLKIRLSSKDYERIKNIASKYMYVDCIEEYIE